MLQKGKEEMQQLLDVMQKRKEEMQQRLDVMQKRKEEMQQLLDVMLRMNGVKLVVNEHVLQEVKVKSVGRNVNQYIRYSR